MRRKEEAPRCKGRGKKEQGSGRTANEGAGISEGIMGTDNILRYATLLREIVTQFDSGKNERVIWELSLSPRSS